MHIMHFLAMSRDRPLLLKDVFHHAGRYFSPGTQTLHMAAGERRLTDIKHFCLAISTLPSRQRGLILRHLTRTQAVYLKELSLNVLTNDSLQLTEAEKRYLRTKLLTLKRIASHSVSFEEKKQIVGEESLMIKKLCVIAIKYFNGRI